MVRREYYKHSTRAANEMDGNSNQLICALMIALGRSEVTITHDDWEAADDYLLGPVIKTGDREATRLTIEQRQPLHSR